MECTIDWLAANGMAFSAETGSGHLLTMDGAAMAAAAISHLGPGKRSSPAPARVPPTTSC